MSNEKRAVWRKGNHLEIAFRGTDPKNMGDLMSDARLMAGRVSDDSRFSRFHQERSWFKTNVVDKGFTANIQGHSLGGSVVLDINRTFNNASIKNATTFNPGHGYYSGLKYRKTNYYDTKSRYAKRTVNIVHFDDPISTGAVPGHTLQIPYGETRIYNNLPDTAGRLARHKLDTYTRVPGDEWVGARIPKKIKTKMKLPNIPNIDQTVLGKPKFEFGNNPYNSKQRSKQNINPIFVENNEFYPSKFNQPNVRPIFKPVYWDDDDDEGYDDYYEDYEEEEGGNPSYKAYTDSVFQEKSCPNGYIYNTQFAKCIIVNNDVFMNAF